MSHYLFLDSGPLGLITHPQRTAEVIAVTDWLSRALQGGSRVLVAAIVYYELKRELLRAEKLLSINRLDAFVNANPGRYVPLSDPALRLAAELWAKSRQAGQPTAHSKALDIDVILAAQALSFGAPPAEVVIATTNPKHLAQFITAKNWFEILWNSQTPRRQDRKRPPRLRGCPRGAQLYRCCLTVDWRFSGY